MARLIICLLILQFYAISLATAATSSVFYLNSTLPSTWRNDDSLNLTSGGANNSDSEEIRAILMRKRSIGFACGFYRVNASHSLFSVMLVGGSNTTVVWSANGNQPVKENATLQLTRDGDLVLRDSDGSRIWSTNTSGKSVAGFNMTELGNLVLFTSNGSVVWQSFDHPTDTLLYGQRLYQNQMLISGLYYATLTMDSTFAAYTQVGNGSQMYYQLGGPGEGLLDQVPSGGHCRLLAQDENSNSTSNGRVDYAELLTGLFLVNLGTSNGSQSPLDSFVEYVRINSNGQLKLYRYGGARQSEMIDMVTEELGECQQPRVCGELGVCKNNGTCDCPIETHGNQSNGVVQCLRNIPLSCDHHANHTMHQLPNSTYFNLIDLNAAVPNISKSADCKLACQNNCSCSVAFFRHYPNASAGLCYMPSEVLSLREGQIPSYNFSSDTFIKLANPSEGKPRRKRSNLALTLAGTGSAAFVIFLALVLTFFMKCGKTSTTEEEEEDYCISQVPGMPGSFSYEDLRVATRDFREKLGGGAFGSVFKGTLQDGTLVAVKRLHRIGRRMREFLAEVETIGSIHHYNLVRLIGFCAERASSLLVYEYLSNGSLDNWIFYRDQKPCLDWETRKKIALDIAKGLAYLHEECRFRIIHHDIKPQNILLDENFSAKISDFGLSKLIDRKESDIMTTLRGTPGYIAPECGHSRITVKVDIYSFGIVLLEIVCGRRNLDGTQPESGKHLLNFLQKKAEEDRLLDIVENLEEATWDHKEEMERYIRIAAWCLQDDPERRPLMSTVVKVLEGVMEVDPSISYKFIHAMGRAHPRVSKSNDLVSQAPQASVLSNPR